MKTNNLKVKSTTFPAGRVLNFFEVMHNASGIKTKLITSTEKLFSVEKTDSNEKRNRI